MQRWIEQADRHRHAVHDGEEFGEILALHGEQLVECGASARLILGEDHFAHHMDTLAFEEHVLGAAKANAFGTEGAGSTCIGWRIGIGAHRHAARAIGPFHQLAEIAGKLRLRHRHFAPQHAAGRTIDGDDVALAQHAADADQHAIAQIHAHGAGTGDARDTHAARNHRRMARHTAAGGENTLGRMHAMNIFGAGFHAHQYDAATFRLGGNGFFGAENNLSGCAPGDAGRPEPIMGLSMEESIVGCSN